MWIIRFFRSSLGRKFIMALTGLFLISFLLVHLLGNLLLLINDEGESFTAFVHFMESNPIIGIMAIGLLSTFVIHIIQGIDVWIAGRRAKGVPYAVKTDKNAGIFSKYMFWLGIVILLFLIVHLENFWFKLKIINTIGDDDLYGVVIDAFKNPLIIITYELGAIALFMHLRHGFQSAFQTLGLNHGKWTPLIKTLGIIYSVLIPLGFFIIPLYVYFFK